MKSFIITILIGAVMVTGSILYARHLEKEADSLLGITKEIKSAINNDDYENAEKHIDKLNKRVNKFEKFFLATGDHIEIDNIKIHLSELKSFNGHNMKSDALSKVYVLEFLFSHLPHNSQVRMGNIL